MLTHRRPIPPVRRAVRRRPIRRATLPIAALGCALLLTAVAAGEDQPAPTLAERVQAALNGTPEKPAAGPDQSVGLTEQGLIQLHVSGLDLATVLRMLSIQSQRNIISSPDVSGTVTANLYNVTFEEALAAVLRSLGLTYVVENNFVYVMSQEEYDRRASADRKPIGRVFVLHYITAGDAAVLVQPLLSTEGLISSTAEAEKGVASNPEAAGGDSHANHAAILVRDYPDHLERIAEALRELDVRPKQVLIEATILRAQLRDSNEMGVDFSLVAGVDFQTVGGMSNGGVNLTLGDVPPAQFDDGLISTNTEFAGEVTPGGFTFGVIKDQVAVFLRALEEVTDATVLANPKILALNKQRGEVIVGRRDGYLTTTVTETAAVQSVQFLETGTQLIFRPFIGDDGYVRMELHPEDSVGGLTAANLPFEETTELTTNIIVRDGHTILIGGLFRERTTAGRSQVPLLGNIPLVGPLFQRSRDEIAREEIIILLTIHIVKHSPAEDAAFDSLADDIERVRVGARRRVMGYGRERLAQAHYRWAVEHLNQNDLAKAMWDLSFALHNNPRMMNAVKLEERIRRRRIWDEEGSRMRTFINGLIDETGAEPDVLFGRPDVLHNPNLPDPDAPPEETTDGSENMK